MHIFKSNREIIIKVRKFYLEERKTRMLARNIPKFARWSFL